jgi:SNF2 family DNA or RNA helicase
LTWLRELSDGFQYKHIEDGLTKCPVCEDGTTPLWVDPADENKTFEMVDMLDDDYVATLLKTTVECTRCGGSKEVPKIIRTATQIPCPKDNALKDLLEENEEQGRLVVFAGFTGSIDRIVDLCLKQKWAVVRVDGRGWKVYDIDGNSLHQEDSLSYWADLDNARVVFVAHPQSGGLGLTLTESRMAVFYSNDWNPESRLQAEDRIHRIGTDMNKGATIVDLIHLPSDEHVRDVLQDNRRLELLTLGEIENMFNDEEEN